VFHCNIPEKCLLYSFELSRTRRKECFLDSLFGFGFHKNCNAAFNELKFSVFKD